jgi:hypothetical protein
MRTLRAGAVAAACLAAFAASAALAAEPAPGSKAADGSIFAGVIGGARLYALPDDPKPLSWGAAKEYCQKLDAHGHQDWAMPDDAELELLYKNHKAIGGFKPTDYASGEIVANVDTRNFADGGEGEGRPWDVVAFRCVRKG